MTDFISDVIQILQSRNIAERDNIFGCTDADIARVQEQYDYPLPNAYKEFLKAMGKGAGNLFQGSDVFFPECIDLRAMAIEILSEDVSSPSLPPDAVVFGMHQGYQFFFIRASEGDDPVVHFFNEGVDSFESQSMRFSEFMVKCAKGWS